MAYPAAELDLEHIFRYHEASAAQVLAYEAIRGAAKQFAAVVLEHAPGSADRTDAIRKLRECVMTANASIALDGRLHVEAIDPDFEVKDVVNCAPGEYLDAAPNRWVLEVTHTGEGVGELLVFKLGEPAVHLRAPNNPLSLKSWKFATESDAECARGAAKLLADVETRVYEVEPR